MLMDGFAEGWNVALGKVGAMGSLHLDRDGGRVASLRPEKQNAGGLPLRSG